jgi:Zn finger protein HypA/HybF involved in hydrogenase expression
MANALTHIINAIRSKDYTTATENVAQVMQRKIEERLAQERAKVASGLLGESVTSPAAAKFSAEDSSGGRAIPGKCVKCGKPAQWYHNRLDQKFCSDHAPNDTMSRIQPVKEASLHSLSMKCLECGKKFRSSSPDPKCPKCGGYDIDLSEGWADQRPRRHQCKECGYIWMGPLDDHECPQCGASEWHTHTEDCGTSHKK